MSKHTPGPWNCGASSIINDDGLVVARTTNTMSFADASLIAAAPEMYEALKQVVLYCDREIHPSLVQVAEEVLAKAEGRS
jgi:hypothetical protein